MREELLTQLEEWHEEDEFEEIVDAITNIPAEERDYELISHLGRAYNNLERYEDAIEQFLLVEEEGTDDPLWHYRMGLAYYYLERYEDAEREFRIADRLEPGDEDTLEFLEWIEREKAEDSGEESVSAGEGTIAEDGAPLEEEGAAVGEPAASGAAAPVVRAAASAVPLDLAHDPLSFWNDEAPAAELYTSAPPSDELIASIEEELVFKLPISYISMMKQHNGGAPRNRFYPAAAVGTGEAIEITGVLGIGRDKKRSLCGTSGSRQIIEQGGYPEIGVVIAQGPSGNDIIMLDYREAGNDGEPEVVHIDKEHGYKMTTLAPSFESFIQTWAQG
ncbi:SMI1/KNR4 family protein [Paenibacillus lemnae]|uniref:SMI1/KNR4 family protein n=1 Tax=Paenibacillus lemnae TaxID=1330551 RepID=A0A848M3B9_PAELE|nr:SMI1/KNR4 family protein [Paenibacillus lemnae]NMO94343.1 SMI1/KNR4 family protein [Paenibacillus lemnae]